MYRIYWICLLLTIADVLTAYKRRYGKNLCPNDTQGITWNTDRMCKTTLNVPAIVNGSDNVIINATVGNCLLLGKSEPQENCSFQAINFEALESPFLRSMELHKDSFKAVSTVKDYKPLHIYMTRIELDFIECGAFDNAPIETIDLSGTELETINSCLFKTCTALGALDLNHNQLISLPPNLLKHNDKLYLVNLESNPLQWTSINLVSVFGTPKMELRALFLSNTRMEHFPSEISSITPNLKYLHISRNCLHAIPSKVLIQFPQLVNLDLSYNNIITLTTFETKCSPPASTSVDVEGNGIENIAQIAAGIERCSGKARIELTWPSNCSCAVPEHVQLNETYSCGTVQCVKQYTSHSELHSNKLCYASSTAPGLHADAVDGPWPVLGAVLLALNLLLAVLLGAWATRAAVKGPCRQRSQSAYTTLNSIFSASAQQLSSDSEPQGMAYNTEHE